MKVFSHKYINESEALNKSIVGFEFEFYCNKPYYILLDKLNKLLSPIKVWGRRKYHSDLDVDEKNFKIEPDTSGGDKMIELITGPMPYANSKIILLKILKFMQENTYTNEKSGIHINISFEDDNDGDSDKLIDKINAIKSILNIDEDYIYRLFPDRKNNYYAKSVKNIIPYKGFSFADDAANILMQNMELPDTKYFGMNIKNVYVNRRLEFRYVGGKDYQFKTKEIIELLDYFIIHSWNSITNEFDDEDKEKLIDYLTKNISNFKNFASFENFIAEFPSIQLEVDKDDSFIIVKSYYGDFYNELYDLMMNIYNLSNCIINFDTNSKRLEIVDGSFKVIFDIKNTRFIDCTITDGEFEGCLFSNCDLKNSHVYSSKFVSTDIYNSKLTNCQFDFSCILKKSYVYGGFLDGRMESGIIRSSQVGPNAQLESAVDVISDEDSYFGVKHDDIEKGKKKGMAFTKQKDIKF